MLGLMLLRTSDESVVDSTGQVIYISVSSASSRTSRDREITAPFAAPDPVEAVAFNDEHILPDWILRRYALHSRLITLPNTASTSDIWVIQDSLLA